MAFKSEVQAEKVRTYMTRNLPDRLHYRLALLARKRRVTLEEMFNMALERGLLELEKWGGEVRG